MWGNEPSHPKWTFILRVGVPNGLLNIQRAITKVRTQWIEAFFISLERSWNVDVWNGLIWPIWNTNYGQKKGQESNWQFDSRPLKVKNYHDFLMCRWCATYCWKDLDKGYNFVLDLIAIKGLHAKLWAHKVVESQLWEFRDSHLGGPKQNVIWMWALWKGTKYTIRGKVVDSPSPGDGESCESEVAHGSS